MNIKKKLFKNEFRRKELKNFFFNWREMIKEAKKKDDRIIWEGIWMNGKEFLGFFLFSFFFYF